MTFYGTSKPENSRMAPLQAVLSGGGAAMVNCNGVIRNNTVSDNYHITPSGPIPGGLQDCKGTIVNNIIYHTTMTAALEFSNCSTPTYCLFRAPRAGQGNVTGDPKFINPAAGDYRLQSTSPAIDAGKTQPDLKADFGGVQRDLNAAGATSGRGDGSKMDIGAYENLPKPVAVWLPEGGPPGDIKDGQALSVSWALDASAGTTIHLYLRQGTLFVRDLGAFTSATGTATQTITLPAPLATAANYTVFGTTISSAPAASASAIFKITGTRKNAIGPSAWLAYN